MLHLLFKSKSPVTNERLPLIERRKMHRIKVIVAINCCFPGEKSSFKIMTENINALGVKFNTSQSLRPGQAIDMQILLYSQVPPIKLRGSVVWCEKWTGKGSITYTGGIKFSTMEVSDSIFLDAFLEKYSTHQYDSPF